MKVVRYTIQNEADVYVKPTGTSKRIKTVVSVSEKWDFLEINLRKPSALCLSLEALDDELLSNLQRLPNLKT